VDVSGGEEGVDLEFGVVECEGVLDGSWDEEVDRGEEEGDREEEDGVKEAGTPVNNRSHCKAIRWKWHKPYDPLSIRLVTGRVV